MRRDNRSNNVRNLKLLAIFGSVAAGAGYVAGLLTAPNSGKETRDNIKKTTNKGYAVAEKELKNLNREITNAIDQARDGSSKLSSRAQDELDNLIDAAKDTKEKGREMLSAIHDGSAEDKDLKKAIKEANAALNHLRDYLKK